MLASHNGHKEVVQVLVDKGADVQAKNKVSVGGARGERGGDGADGGYMWDVWGGVEE